VTPVPGRLRTVLVGVAAFLVGAPFAFFLGGPAFFANGPYAQRLIALALSATALFVLGLAGGALAPARARVIGVALAAPILPVIALLTEWDKPELALLSVAFLIADLSAGIAGALVGAALRRRRAGPAS
jgi:hypothetical protein